MTRVERSTAVVLAAGAATRFGGGKLLATIAGRPMLQHVLDAVAAAGLSEVVVVLGSDAATVEAAIDWRAECRVVNPSPEDGLSSSLRVGFEAVPPATEAVLIALGDQPLMSPGTIRSLLEAPATPDR